MSKHDQQPMEPLEAWPRRVALFAGGAAALLGLTVLAGWHGRWDAVIRLDPGFAPMQYNTALCFLMAGLGMVATALNRQPVARLFSLATMLLAGLSLAQYLTGTSFGVDQLLLKSHLNYPPGIPGRMAKSSTFCFSLLGLGILAINLQRIPRWLPLPLALGCTSVIAFCSAATFAYASGLHATFGWLKITAMALHTASGIVVLGSGLLALAWEREPSLVGRAPRWLPIPVTLGAAAVVLMIANALGDNAKADGQQILQADALSVKNEINARMEARIRALKRMAKRWGDTGRPDRAEWESDALSYCADFPGYQAIEWVDPSFVVRWVVPAAGNESVLDRNLAEETRRRQALESARDRREAIITKPVNLVQGGRGLLAYVPIFRGDLFDGLIVGVFKIDELFEAILPPSIAPGYLVSLYSDEELFYARAPGARPPDLAPTAQANVELHGAEWRVEVWPGADLQQAHFSALPALTLVTGILGSLLLGLTVYLVQNSRARADEVHSVNRQLLKENLERKRAEEALQQSYLLQYAILNSADFSIISTRPDGVIVSINAAAERMLGYQASELVGKATPAIIHDGDEVACRAAELTKELGRKIEPGFETFVARARLGASDEQEWTYVRKDGSRFPVRLSVTALFNPQGQLQGFLGIAADITARKHAEKELASNEALLRQFIAHAPAAIAMLDNQMRYLQTSERWLKDYGIKEADIIGKGHYEVFPDVPQRWREIHQRVLQGAVEHCDEDPFPRADGTVEWLQWEARPWRKSSGEIGGLIFYTQVITARKRSEEATRQSEELFRQAFGNAPIGMAVVGTNGTWQRVNRALCDIVGYAPGELLRTDFQTITHPDDLDADLAQVEQLLAGTINSYQIEKRYIHKKGHEVSILLSVSPVRNLEGKVVFFVSQIQDITERKRAQEELAAARDAALESSRLKAEFLANMSHEIRTPMNGVMGMTNLLLNTTLSVQQRAYCETVRRSAESLLTILNDILDFSKIEAGKLVFENIDFNVREVVEGCVEILAGQANAKDIEAVSILHRNVPVHLRGDPGRLRQILTNLTGNAIKFTHRGEVVVRVTAVNVTETDALLRFSVTDTGIGISAEAQKRLFQVFSQADGSTTRKYGGTGLGLAISKQLVNQMGGEIGVDSEPGKGSTFWFTARFSRQDKGQTQIFTRKWAQLDGLSILIVNDHPTSRAILQQQVGAWGMRERAVPTAEEALATLKHGAATDQRFDVAIVDLEADAFKLAATIRADPLISKTHLIMLTAPSEQIEDNKLKAHGVDAGLVKPVGQSRLFDSLVSVTAGTAFAFPAAGVSQSGPTPPPGGVSEGGGNLRILLAEDNEVNQQVALGFLHRLGHEADLANNGREALERLQGGGYDVVLMDCQMPELDGYETAQRIRELEKAGQAAWMAPLHVIAMTANAMVGDREKCLAAGMTDYISKPLREAELSAALKRCPVSRGSAAPKAAAIPDAKAPAPAQKGLVDWEQLDEFSLGQPDMLADLLRLILAQSQQLLDELDGAVKTGNVPLVCEKSHKLRGTCLQMGSLRMAEPLQKMEDQSHAGDIMAAPFLLEEASRTFALIRTELETKLRELGVG